jgi:hypothetical protein
MALVYFLSRDPRTDWKHYLADFTNQKFLAALEAKLATYLFGTCRKWDHGDAKEIITTPGFS